MSGSAKVVKTKLFIGNLDPGTQAGELSELFSPFGQVLEASVIKDYGFVHFGSIEEAEKAAAALSNKEFHGKRLRVELSTSTVRHRPGQPEPASALRHSRARTTGKGHSNGTSRYNSGASGNGGGPMRHHASTWGRHDARPYDNIPIDHGGYDRARPYDMRSDSRHYYDDRRDNGYGSEYDAPGYGRSSGGGSLEARHYRDLPSHIRADSYGPNRPYERHPGLPPADPYYGGGLPPHGPPPPIDPYHNYDPYQKYYAGRARDPEYPGQREYDLYPNYRNDSYGISNSSQGVHRHDLPVDLQSPHGGYPPSHRQHPSYPSGSSNHAQYYGIQQR